MYNYTIFLNVVGVRSWKFRENKQKKVTFDEVSLRKLQRYNIIYSTGPLRDEQNTYLVTIRSSLENEDCIPQRENTLFILTPVERDGNYGYKLKYCPRGLPHNTIIYHCFSENNKDKQGRDLHIPF